MSPSDSLSMRTDDDLVALWRYEDDGCPIFGASMAGTAPSSDGGLLTPPVQCRRGMGESAQQRRDANRSRSQVGKTNPERNKTKFW